MRNLGCGLAALAIVCLIGLRAPGPVSAQPLNGNNHREPPVKVILPEESDFQEEEGGTFRTIRRSIERLFGVGEEDPDAPKKSAVKEVKPSKKAKAEAARASEKKAEVKPAPKAAAEKPAEAKKKEPEARKPKMAEAKKEEVKEGIFTRILNAVRRPLQKGYSKVAGLLGRKEEPVETAERPEEPKGPLDIPAPPASRIDAPRATQLPQSAGLLDLAAFQRGYTAFRRGSCGSAAELMSYLLLQYPTSPMVEPSLYILGECLYRIGHADQNSGRPSKYKKYYRLAENVLRDATLRFPGSKLAPHGYYRIVEMNFYLHLYPRVLGMVEYYLRSFPMTAYHPRVRLVQAKAMANMRDYDGAGEAFYHVVYDFPESEEVSEAIYGLADLNVIQGRYEESLTLYNDGNKRWPKFIRTHPEAMLKLALAFEKTRFYDEALSLLFFLQGQYGRRDFSDEVQLRIGTILALKKSYDDAVNAYTRVVNQYGFTKSAPHALVGLADIALQRPVETKLRGGWWETNQVDPEHIYREVARRHPLDPVGEAAQYKLALLLFTERRYEESLRAMERMIKTYPYGRFAEGAKGDLFDVFKDGIHYYYDSKDYMTVLKLHDSFIESPFLRGAFDIEVLYVLGKSFYEMGIYAKAREFLYRVIQKWPPKDMDEHSGFLIGASYLREGDFSRAEEILRKHLDVFPNGKYRREMLFSLGEATYNLDKYEDTITAFGQYLFTRPESERAILAFYYIGNSLYAKARYIEASEAYASVLSLARDQSYKETPAVILESQFQLADSFYLSNLYEPAVKAYQEAYQLAPDGERREWAQYRIGYLQELLKQPQEALKGYAALGASGDTMWQTISAGLKDFARAKEVYQGYFKTDN